MSPNNEKKKHRTTSDRPHRRSTRLRRTTIRRLLDTGLGVPRAVHGGSPKRLVHWPVCLGGYWMVDLGSGPFNPFGSFGLLDQGSRLAWSPPPHHVGHPLFRKPRSEEVLIHSSGRVAQEGPPSQHRGPRCRKCTLTLCRPLARTGE